jgi:hypothetical protein
VRKRILAAYNTLLNLFHTLADKTIAEAVGQVLSSSASLPTSMHTEIKNASLREWAKAIHSSRADSITLSTLSDSLKTVGKFSEHEITQEVAKNFFQITVQVDAAMVCQQYDVEGNGPVIKLSYQSGLPEMEKKNSASVNPAELKITDTNQKLMPDCSITWKFITSSGEDSLQLKSFYVDSYDDSKRPPHRTKINNTESISGTFRSHESPTNNQSTLSYFFDFTINNGKQLFRIPALSGELIG